MKYFVAKIQYSEPIPEGDGIKKVTKKYLVRAESVTEVEIKCQQWFISNWQDPTVRSVTETPIQEILQEGESESYWQIKVMFEDTDSGKWTPHIIAVNGVDIQIAIKRAANAHSMGEIHEAKKLKLEFDSELLETTTPAA
jgi:hypothetical protein